MNHTLMTALLTEKLARKMAAKAKAARCRTHQEIQFLARQWCNSEDSFYTDDFSDT